MIPEPKKCKICGNLFSKNYKESITQWENRKCCSTKCGTISATPSRKGRVAWNKDIKLPYTVWNKGKKGFQVWSEEQKILKSENWKKEKNPRWKGGKEFWKMNEHKNLSARYIGWSKDVKERDNWKCKMDNKDCHGRLESHHILNWIDFPELRYDLNNGITLCKFHHPIKKSIAQKMIEEFQNIISRIDS